MWHVTRRTWPCSNRMPHLPSPRLACLCSDRLLARLFACSAAPSPRRAACTTTSPRARPALPHSSTAFRHPYRCYHPLEECSGGAEPAARLPCRTCRRRVAPRCMRGRGSAASAAVALPCCTTEACVRIKAPDCNTGVEGQAMRSSSVQSGGAARQPCFSSLELAGPAAVRDY